MTIDPKKLAALEGVDEAELGIEQPEAIADATPEPAKDPDDWLTPERKARRADALRDLEIQRAERARVPTDKQRFDQERGGGRSGLVIHGTPDCTSVSIFVPVDRRRVF
jgi:hypothetical protein